MNFIEEFKFWVDVIERLSIPANGDRLTKQEQNAIAQTCRSLAQTANYAANLDLDDCSFLLGLSNNKNSSS